MGLDSVAIVIDWEASFGIVISDAEASVLRTPKQSIDFIATKLPFHEGHSPACLTLRAFHRVRNALTQAAQVSRAKIRPNARIRDLVSTNRRQVWEVVRSTCGISSLPNLGWFSRITVGEIARWAGVHSAKDLKPPGEPWTRAEIRSVVRAIVAETTEHENFEDHHDFVHDLGIN